MLEAVKKYKKGLCHCWALEVMLCHWNVNFVFCFGLVMMTGKKGALNFDKGDPFNVQTEKRKPDRPNNSQQKRYAHLPHNDTRHRESCYWHLNTGAVYIVTFYGSGRLGWPSPEADPLPRWHRERTTRARTGTRRGFLQHHTLIIYRFG